MKAQIAFLTDTTSEVSLTSCKEAISIHEPGCMALQAKPLFKCNELSAFSSWNHAVERYVLV